MERSSALEYEAHGTGDVVLLIHGALVADSFAPMMAEPALARCRLVRYRRRGYGGSDRPSDPATIEEHAADALALLDHLGARHAHVVAHSGGGPIAVQLALDAPEVVRSLVLLEPALHTAVMAAAFDELVAPLVEMHRDGNSSKAIHLWMRSVAGSDWRITLEAMLPGCGDQVLRDAAGTFEHDLAAMRCWDFATVGAERLTQPVLYVVGARSADGVERVTALFRAAVPHGDLVVIPDGDHTLQMTEPKPVAEAIAAFLRLDDTAWCSSPAAPTAERARAHGTA